MVNFNSEYQLRLATIALLVKLLSADGLLKTEDKYISYMGNNLDLSIEDIKMVKTNPTKYTLVPPVKEQDRMTIMYHLFFAIKIDGIISQKEEEICFQAGLRLGFNHLLVENMIRILKSTKSTKFPIDAFLLEIKKYLN